MPAELVAGIDRIAGNRSRFIAEAVSNELRRRRHLELLRSLACPHPDSAETASLGLADWASGLPAEEDDLLDPSAGVAVRWIEGQGWQETGS